MADAERSIAFLPGEALAHFSEHARRVAFEVTQRLRQWHGWRQRNEQMKVVGGSSCGQQDDVPGLGNSRDVPAERVRVLDEVGSILGAEDAMHEVGSVGMRHAGMAMKDDGCYGDRRHIWVFGVPSLRDSSSFSRLPSAEALG